MNDNDILGLWFILAAWLLSFLAGVLFERHRVQGVLTYMIALCEAYRKERDELREFIEGARDPADDWKRGSEAEE